MEGKVDILKVLETGNQDDIKVLLFSVKVEQVLKVVKSELIKSKPGAADLVKSLFLASKGLEGPLLDRHYIIYHYVLMLLKQDLVPMGLVAELICVLLIETDTLLTKHLSALRQMFMEALKKGDDLTNRWIEIYPRVLSTLSSREIVEIDGNSFTGVGFREQAIDELIMLRWRIYAVPHIVSLFIDLALTSDELLKVINKCFERLKELDIMDTPVLILHLLRLAEKGHRERVIEGIIKFFNDKDKQKANETTINSAEDERCKALRLFGNVKRAGNPSDETDQALSNEYQILISCSQTCVRLGKQISDLKRGLDKTELDLIEDLEKKVSSLDTTFQCQTFFKSSSTSKEQSRNITVIGNAANAIQDDNFQYYLSNKSIPVNLSTISSGGNWYEEISRRLDRTTEILSQSAQFRNQVKDTFENNSKKINNAWHLANSNIQADGRVSEAERGKALFFSN